MVLASEEIEALWDSIQNENSVLFLGQNYQKTFWGEDYFARNVSNELCGGSANSLAYKDLWAGMCEKAAGKNGVARKATLTDAQKEKLIKIDSTIPANESLRKVMNVGWSSVITSAVDSGLERRGGLSSFNPIYNVNTSRVGLGNKRNLSISYLYGSVQEISSIPDTYRLQKQRNQDAATIFDRVIKSVIPYTGCFVVDGWNPETDWFNLQSLLLTSFEVDSYAPKIYLFSTSEDILDDNDELEEMQEYGRLFICEKSFYECFEQYFLNSMEEESDDEYDPSKFETISVYYNKNSYSINVPYDELYKLDQDHIHLMTDKDRIQVGYSRDGISELTKKFLAVSGESFPVWQGYQQNCCFYRNTYEGKGGLKETVLSALKSPNLHKSYNTIILQGTSNSGKSILLGKLAVELSKNYPVLFMKGNVKVLNCT